MNGEQSAVPADPGAPALDLEAQKISDHKAPNASLMEGPADPASVDSHTLGHSVDVHPTPDGVENPPPQARVDPEVELRTPRAALGEQSKDRPLAINAECIQVQALKDRYKPVGGLRGPNPQAVLDFLHHANINHLRVELLQKYAFLKLPSELSSAGMISFPFFIASQC
jgi:hypothetical protein